MELTQLMQEMHIFIFWPWQPWSDHTSFLSFTTMMPSKRLLHDSRENIASPPFVFPHSNAVLVQPPTRTCSWPSPGFCMQTPTPSPVFAEGLRGSVTGLLLTNVSGAAQISFPSIEKVAAQGGKGLSAHFLSSRFEETVKCLRVSMYLLLKSSELTFYFSVFYLLSVNFL